MLESSQQVSHCVNKLQINRHYFKRGALATYKYPGLSPCKLLASWFYSRPFRLSCMLSVCPSDLLNVGNHVVLG